jgi:hypothetical protein
VKSYCVQWTTVPNKKTTDEPKRQDSYVHLGVWDDCGKDQEREEEEEEEEKSTT